MMDKAAGHVVARPRHGKVNYLLVTNSLNGYNPVSADQSRVSRWVKYRRAGRVMKPF
jgi:hypothetical protein